jgi:hypothetical protein
MAQGHKKRLDRLEMRSGCGGCLLVVVEDPQGNLTTLDGEPWSEDQAGAQDLVVRIWSSTGGGA